MATLWLCGVFVLRKTYFDPTYANPIVHIIVLYINVCICIYTGWGSLRHIQGFCFGIAEASTHKPYEQSDMVASTKGTKTIETAKKRI
jgi:hypothetical protein